MAIVTVFSGLFCDGEDVAELVARQLGYRRIEDELLDETSKRFSVSKDKLARTLNGGVSVFGRVTREREKNTAYLKVVLSELISRDRSVLFGNASHLVPVNIAHVLKVFVIGNMDYRLDRAEASSGLSVKAAQKAIQNEDKKQGEWLARQIGKSPHDDSLYDIVLPMHESSVEDAAKLICEKAESDPLSKTELSQQKCEDFILAARVNLKLVEEGQVTEVTSDNGEVTIQILQDVVNMQAYQEKLREIAAQVPGVTAVNMGVSARFHATATNPWANIEAPPSVLLVDDEKEFVHTLSERLQTRNFDSAVVYDGEQALDFVDSDEPDVMVLDLMMPGIDGLEVLRRIRREHPNIEVIILTGHGSDREETVARDLGAFAYLKKPVSINKLTETMKEAYQKVDRARADSEID